MNKRPSALQLEIAGQIAELIGTEGMPADAPLREETLAARFGVSRSPVRAALRLLGRSGHVYHKENAGVFVASGAATRAAFRVPKSAGSAEALYRRVLADRGKGILGETVSEAELMGRYKVARSLLGKVLMRLNREGLAERRKGHGWQFQPALHTPEEIADSFRFRRMVECASLTEPGFHAEPGELARLRQAHERFLALPHSGRSAAEFFSMNLLFHEKLAEWSGNRFVLQSIQQMNLLRKLQEFASFSEDSEALEQSCREHLEILEAVAKDDREWAAALMRKHLGGGHDRVVRAGQKAGSVFDKGKIQS